MFKILKTSWVLILPIAVLMVTSCKEEAKKTIATQNIDFTKEGELSIFKNSTDTLLTKLDIEIAETDYETQTGLMYRKGMEQNQGMLFVFPDEAVHSFYMKNTEFPLDILYIDEDFKIASVQENAAPLNEGSLSSEVPVQYVLEVNAGYAERQGVTVGDSISYTRNK